MIVSAVLFAFIISSVPAAYSVINSDVTNGSNAIIFTFEGTIIIPSEDDLVVDYSPTVINDSAGNPLPNPAYEFEYTGTSTGNDDFSAGVEGVFCFTFSVNEVIHITADGIKFNFQTEIGKYYSMVNGILYSANPLTILFGWLPTQWPDHIQNPQGSDSQRQLYDVHLLDMRGILFNEIFGLFAHPRT